MTTSFRTPASEPTFVDLWAFSAILSASVVALAFLLWLVYLHTPSPGSAGQWMFLPKLNATLNGLSAVALCIGFYFIKQRNWRAHPAGIVPAFGLSSLFSVGFIPKPAPHRGTPFP